MAPLSIVVVYNKENRFGLQRDAELLAEQLVIAGRKANLFVGKVKLMDPREPPVTTDICIHLEVPYPVWFPWSKINCMLVNPEWWLKSWNGISSNFDMFLFKNQEAALNAEKLHIPDLNIRNSVVIPWFTGRNIQDIHAIVQSSKKPVAPTITMKRELIWFLAGSVSKRKAAEAILPLWRFDFPVLHVYTTQPLSAFNQPLQNNVIIHVQDLSREEHASLAKQYFGHICFSTAEGFGYTASEAELLGTYLFLNTHPTYESIYKEEAGISWIKTENKPHADYPIGLFSDFSNIDRLENDLAYGIHKFLSCDPADLYKSRMQTITRRQEDFMKGLGVFLKECQNILNSIVFMPKHMPPLLNIQDCPPISIVTLTYNRPNFIENAILNLLSTDYPRDKIEWVVVDDSDVEKSPSDRIVKFAEQFEPGKVTYVPCFKKLNVGRKRNVGCNKASHDIILMMDDDDHYPVSSFRRRVAWLQKAKKPYAAAVCTTIAMYDLLKGTSAVNVPPYTLSLAERCSEATLTFTKKFWSDRHFKEVDMAEGEDFLKGREESVVEIPSQQIIVALNHKENLSSRRIPGSGGETNNGCFWGFPRELLVFLHGLAGVKVEAQ